MCNICIPFEPYIKTPGDIGLYHDEYSYGQSIPGPEPDLLQNLLCSDVVSIIRQHKLFRP